MPPACASIRAHDDEVHPRLPGDLEDLVCWLTNRHPHLYRHWHLKVLLGKFIKLGPRLLFQLAEGLVAPPDTRGHLLHKPTQGRFQDGQKERPRKKPTMASTISAPTSSEVQAG
jgi:hypothetical protein